MHKLHDISAMKTDLIDELKHEIRCKGYSNMNTMEVGQVIDMIKDLASAEKNCMEKYYYENVIDAMHEHDYGDEFEVEAAGRMGYDNRRYSNGRYAPKGRGHYSPVHGYTPSGHVPVYMNDHMPYYTDDRMGYPHMTRSQSGTSHNTSYGYTPMDRYKEAKRGYEETHHPEHKDKMSHHAKEHLDETVESMREIWIDATPELKKDIKSGLSKLLAEMQI